MTRTAPPRRNQTAVPPVLEGPEGGCASRRDPGAFEKSMTSSDLGRTAGPFFVLVFVAGCGGAVASTPAGGPAPMDGGAAAPAHSMDPEQSDPDVAFMRDMIVHHRQALDMAALVPDRSSNEALKSLALRIDASQKDEIARMRRWLSGKGVEAPDADLHSMHHDQALMPGMLTPDEMAELAAARGERFDRLFLEGMIKHHQGALNMVSELTASGGAVRDMQVYTLASQIDADQRAEIARMRRLLGPGE